MPYLKLHREDHEPEAPQPIPFRSLDRSWRQAGQPEKDSPSMDSINQVEKALLSVERNLDELSRQVEEHTEPLRIAEWLDEDDDGPWAA